MNLQFLFMKNVPLNVNFLWLYYSFLLSLVACLTQSKRPSLIAADAVLCTETLLRQPQIVS